MTRSPKIRKANYQDIPFLVEAIIEAEKGGSDKLSYATIFSLSQEAVRNVLSEILAEDVEGQELCVSSFDIAEVDEQLAGAVCSWIEASTGQPSSLLKATLLNHFIPATNMQTAVSKKDILVEIAIEKPKHALILESVYTVPAFRKCGIFSALMTEKVNAVRTSNPDINTCALTVMKTNESALCAYQRVGFRVVLEKTSHNPLITDLLPSNTRVLMEKNI
jgi:ribosomal protein S18 acetylase RimI-like enzyme